jgi:flagellar basal-body rod protein FlgF
MPNFSPVLDAGEAPITLPAGVADIAIGGDGTISADGQSVGQVGLFNPSDPKDLFAAGGTFFEARAGFEPAEAAQILQGFLEESNVSPVRELTRMIEVQRAYEQGQKFLDGEHNRIKNVIQTIARSS